MYNPIQRRHFMLAAVLAGSTLASACMHTAHYLPPAQRDFASERLSDGGRYRVSWRADANPVPIGSLHTWTLHVARPDGAAVTDAAITVDGDMPEHGHGLPTRPRVTRNLGNGDYLVEGVKFQMGGWWVMEFQVASGGVTEPVRFNLQLQR